MTTGVLRQHISRDLSSFHDTGGAPTAYFARPLFSHFILFSNISLDFSSFHDTGGAPTAYFVRLLITS